MDRIPLISSSSDLGGRIIRATAACRSDPPRVRPLKDPHQALDYLNVELPELVFIHFPDRQLNTYGLLDTIMGDPWLVHGGIIALCDDDDAVERLEGQRGANLVVIVSSDGLDAQLPRVLDIIGANRRILFQREIGAGLIDEISGHFELSNDPLEARCYTNLICNFLFYTNRIDASARDSLNLALYEILVNAIEHGNCGITYEEKTEWLESHGSMSELIAERHRNPDVARKRVVFEYRITSTASQFFVADEGPGFDWREIDSGTEAGSLLQTHGRGILMARAVTRNLRYNERGNEVRFELDHQSDRANLTPGPFRTMEPRQLGADEVVFCEGDAGNFLYYIVKGRYDVLVGDRTVATLTPEDVFLGEMSFLLNNRRSASIRARTPGELIEISKRDFMDAIKQHPHYALLLSRLLAQRIDRANNLFGR